MLITGQAQTEAMWQPVIDLIFNAQTIVLTTHENSDGDGLGSQTGLFSAFHQLGKRVTVMNATVIPLNYRFLFEPFVEHDRAFEPIVFNEESEAHHQTLQSADLVFVLDTNHVTRTRRMRPVMLERQAAGKTKIVCIDHHLEPEAFADICICLDYASATGELVHGLIRALEKRTGKTLLDLNAARGVYTAIMTDTGSFKFPKTSAHVHRITAELLELGVSPMQVYEAVFNNQTFGSLRLAGMGIDKIRLAEEGNIAYLCVTQLMLKETATGLSDTEKLTDYMMAMPKTRIAMMFIEMPDGATKVSFRSRGDIFVNEVAKIYGGGGHKNAAGCTIYLPILEAIESAVSNAKKLLD